MYSWSVVRSSSPGRNRSDASTALTPVVAFGHEREAVGVRAQEARHLATRLVQQALELAGQEPHGLALEAVAPRALGVEDGSRAGAEGAVVEERDRGVESPRRAVDGRGTRRPERLAIGHAGTLCDGGVPGGPPAASAGLVGALAGYDAGSRTDAR